MVKIDKPNEIPNILQTKGKDETENLIKEYENGKIKFKFDDKIYRNEEIKKKLREIQFNKCCFCEQKIEFGHIEHYRPKRGYKQDQNEKQLTKPGYYWLAYDWDNLLLSCPTCNSSYKKNYFPLKDPSKRAMSYKDDITKEEPLIINPAKEDPEDYIEFYGTSIRAKNGNQKGKETIKTTGLDRPFINEDKLEYYRICKELYQSILDLDENNQKRIRMIKLLEQYSQEDKKYSLMIKCAIRDEFRY